ncbi:ATP-binding protein [Flavobacteriaceae bacterium]|nr:ATP-binding protein [Flavobacteriaceae bacterium]
MPKSIFNKLILIFILPTIISQAVIIYVFLYNKSRHVEEKLAFDAIKEIKLLKQNISDHKLTTHISNLTDINFSVLKNYKSTADWRLRSSKQSRIINNFIRAFEESGMEIYDFIYDGRDIKIFIFHEKDLLLFSFDDGKVFNIKSKLFIRWILGITVLMSFLAIIFTKNQLKSIKHLVNVVNKFGKSDDIKNFSPSGPSEIKRLGGSFLRMRRRIHKDIEEKALFLSSISHDLRTPLARMRLNLEMMQGSEVTGMKQDVSDMEQMINQYLRYSAKEVQNNLQILTVEQLKNFIFSSYSKHYNKITINAEDIKLQITVNIINIKRMINNIVDNGLKYGDRVIISFLEDSGFLRIIVEDDGEGIPKKKRKEVLNPFVRLDKARNLADKNVGLGLSIVQRIVKEHLGKISLAESEVLGGLKVEIKIPLI